MEENEHNNLEDSVTANHQRLNIDFAKLFSDDDAADEEPPPEIEVVPTAAADDRPRQQGEEDQVNYVVDELARMSDYDLEEKINRLSNTYSKLKLSDGGAKLRVSLKRYEDEKKRRQGSRVSTDANGCEKPAVSARLSCDGVSDQDRQGNPSSEGPSQSRFASCLMEKLEDKTSAAFDSELSCLGPCNNRKRKHNGLFSSRKRDKPPLSVREFNEWRPSDVSRANDKHKPLNDHREGRASWTCSSSHLKEKIVGSFANRDSSQEVHSDKSRDFETVVLVDEEELPVTETIQKTEEPLQSVKEVSPRTKESKIYYPSREDPESVEIQYEDIKCLDPKSFLSSTIMNFYIRYLQGPASLADRAHRAYHFFNTYFYQKLKEALSQQKIEKEASFIKLRRWWRGVNIFQKAYIFIPIHDDQHWSLVIICIPDKADEMGPIILHLDSLGLHSSRRIFENVKSFLREEWSYLKNDGSPVKVPIPDRIWRNLPRRIEDKIITVPQQNNEYDCGLFVLFFMERFIEKAPERLKKQNLAMFGKSWFRPAEASSLRGKIKKILQEEFHKARENSSSIWEPVSLSSNTERAQSPVPIKTPQRFRALDAF